MVDNSIIVHRLHEWAKGGIVRLHSTEIAFYIQSALESAQLLLIAGLGAVRGAFRVHAITDLGWPVSLLDLTVGVLAAAKSDTPIYISGYDRGYEEIPFPGLYDPATAGEVSPLLNAFEAARVTEAPCHMVDAFPLEMRPDPQPVKLLASIDEACEVTEDPDTIRGALDELSWSLLDVTLQAAPTQALARSAAFADPHRHGLSAEHQRLLAAIRRDAGLGDSMLAVGQEHLLPCGRRRPAVALSPRRRPPHPAGESLAQRPAKAVHTRATARRSLPAQRPGPPAR
ncbi:MAG: hypothetical protein ACLPKE_32610 [Streptosporangiaceae bacterium]